jgi:hypothetical protein
VPVATDVTYKIPIAQEELVVLAIQLRKDWLFSSLTSEDGKPKLGQSRGNTTCSPLESGVQHS